MSIKIVTAFFDIGRGNFNNMSRSDEKYFEYFKFWARIKNDITVYCESKNANRIIAIRKEFGLEDRTHIEIIDDYFNIEPEIYKRMCQIEKNDKFTNFRYFNKAISNRADYCYIMMLKWWCLFDAAQKEESDQMMAWLDFGYNHGGELYTNSNDFDFLWDYPFENKINKFCLSDPRKVSGIDLLQFQADCFIGHTAIMPANYCSLYWDEIRQAIIMLMTLDCFDDDQEIELMVYKKHPDWFNITVCDWFEDMMLCSGRKFEIKEKVNNKSLKSKIKNNYNQYKRKISFMHRTIQRCKEYGR